VAAVDRAEVLLFRTEGFLAVDFLRGDFLADFDEDLEDAEVPDRSRSRIRRRRVSTSSLVASPEREICLRTSRLIVSLNRSLLRRDQSSSCLVSADAWSRRASPCRTRAWARSWALRGVRASRPASMKRRTVSSTAERIHPHPPGIIPPVFPGERLATKEEVERHLRDLIERLGRSDDGSSELERALPERRVLALHVSDLGADYWTELEGGRLGELRQGSPPDRDILMTASSDDLVDLVEGKGSLFSAYLSGRVRIDASVSDLLRLRKLL
jgi:hypothetical protein